MKRKDANELDRLVLNYVWTHCMAGYTLEDMDKAELVYKQKLESLIEDEENKQ